MIEKVIMVEGKRLVVDHISSYYHDVEDHEIVVFCGEQAFNFTYSPALMKALDNLFDIQRISI